MDCDILDVEGRSVLNDEGRHHDCPEPSLRPRKFCDFQKFLRVF
jgi:hypothetical protein